MPEFQNLSVAVEEQVATILLNRPDKANALNKDLWKEIGEAARWVNDTPEVRVAILAGAGRNFTAGIDFALIGGIVAETSQLGEGHKQDRLRHIIAELQSSFTAIEQCRKPFIAAVHGSCIGGGIDLIAACDMRYATADAKFSVKEVDLAIVADIGTLQRLPTIVGEGITRELAFTGRTFNGEEAKDLKIVNRTFADQDELMKETRKIAQAIASKSPLSVRGIKQVLNYCRDNTVANGLAYVAAWNSAVLLSEDAQEAMSAMMEKRAPAFKD